jgi:hypothetical protein
MGNSNPLQESHSIYTVDRMIIRLMVSSIVRFQPGLFCYNPYSVTLTYSNIVQGVWNHQAVLDVEWRFWGSEPPDVAWRTDGQDDDPKKHTAEAARKSGYLLVILSILLLHYEYTCPSSSKIMTDQFKSPLVTWNLHSYRMLGPLNSARHGFEACVLLFSTFFNLLLSIWNCACDYGWMLLDLWWILLDGYCYCSYWMVIWNCSMILPSGNST